MFHRRHFLKSTAAAIAASILPRSLFARTPNHFFFIHVDSCNSWPIADPVVWSLENAHEPVLKRASTGLAKLTANDGDRIIRLVVRRCGLNLIELQPEHVAVQHWGTQGLADLRPFFKAHRLARPEIEVVLRERKKETVTTQPGDSFLYGSQIAADFPLNIFQSKFANRFTQEADDWQAAPSTNSGFAWADVEDNHIPWTALKSAWRRAAPLICQNCDTPTMLVNFGLRQVGIFNRCPNYLSVCSNCCRSFRDDSVTDVGQWIVANLDADLQPDFEIVWGQRTRMQS